MDYDLLRADTVSGKTAIIQQCSCVHRARAQPVSVEGRGFLRKQQSIQSIRITLF